MDDPLKERGLSLEEQFFVKQNADLVARLRATQERDAARVQMKAAAGIEDPAVLDVLLDQGVTAGTFAAFALAPLVAVAWADRKLEDKERAAILAEASKSGVAPGSAEYELLQGWLTQEPPGTLMSTWASYAQAVAGQLSSGQRAEFREALLRRANAVADAAGGFAGMGKKSAEEQRVLDAIAAALPA